MARAIARLPLARTLVGLAELPKAFRLAAAKFSRPPSRAAAELRNSTNHAAYTWHVVVRELSQHPMLSGAALP
eukprot:COSAG06_NODE_4965_length_3825_cov_3.588567_4_plen_72_part_01